MGEDINPDVMNERLKSIDSRLTKIESDQTWVIRLLLGALIAAVIGMVLKGGQL